jgi:hypothetical protein
MKETKHYTEYLVGIFVKLSTPIKISRHFKKLVKGKYKTWGMGMEGQSRGPRVVCGPRTTNSGTQSNHIL